MKITMILMCFYYSFKGVMDNAIRRKMKWTKDRFVTDVVWIFIK